MAESVHQGRPYFETKKPGERSRKVSCFKKLDTLQGGHRGRESLEGGGEKGGESDKDDQALSRGASNGDRKGSEERPNRRGGEPRQKQKERKEAVRQSQKSIEQKSKNPTKSLWGPVGRDLVQLDGGGDQGEGDFTGDRQQVTEEGGHGLQEQVYSGGGDHTGGAESYGLDNEGLADFSSRSDSTDMYTVLYTNAQ